MNPQTAYSRSSRKRSHGSVENELVESSTESNDSVEVEVPKKRKKKFRKGGKKLRLSESKGAASSVLSEMKPERDSDDFTPKLLKTESKNKSVSFHQSSEFLDRNTKEYKEKQKKRKVSKHNPNRDSDDSTTDDDSDAENIILFKSMKNVIASTGDGDGDGQFKMVKVLVEDAHFWSNYNCYAYERNGGVVIVFNDRRNDSERL